MVSRYDDRAGPQTLLATFVGPNARYYALQFERQGTVWWRGLSFNLAAAILGPVWAAGRGVWTWVLDRGGR